MMKSSLVRPETNWPFLSVTVMGKRTRLIGILTVCESSPGGGVGEGFGFCAETDNVAATIMQAAAKDLNKKRVRPVDMRSDYSSGAVRSLLDDAGFDALSPEAVALWQLSLSSTPKRVRSSSPIIASCADWARAAGLSLFRNFDFR